ncbi:TRAP transporter small permease subunit, partial [uncultured Selenomonas sp.]|uniref:TRAP transporter small permease n=1 Tax=uncultured Selenomonas sp. TaxID=159275 RepID=UPI0028D7E24E
MTDILKKLERLIALLASAAMSGIVLLVFINVVLRYCFNTGLTWSDEAAVNLFVWFIFLGGI